MKTLNFNCCKKWVTLKQATGVWKQYFMLAILVSLLQATIIGNAYALPLPAADTMETYIVGSAIAKFKNPAGILDFSDLRTETQAMHFGAAAAGSAVCLAAGISSEPCSIVVLGRDTLLNGSNGKPPTAIFNGTVYVKKNMSPIPTFPLYQEVAAYPAQVKSDFSTALTIGCTNGSGKIHTDNGSIDFKISAFFFPGIDIGELGTLGGAPNLAVAPVKYVWYLDDSATTDCPVSP